MPCMCPSRGCLARPAVPCSLFLVAVFMPRMPAGVVWLACGCSLCLHSCTGGQLHRRAMSCHPPCTGRSCRPACTRVASRGAAQAGGRQESTPPRSCSWHVAHCVLVRRSLTHCHRRACMRAPDGSRCKGCHLCKHTHIHASMHACAQPLVLHFSQVCAHTARRPTNIYI